MIRASTIAGFSDEMQKIAMSQEAKDKLKRFALSTAIGIGGGTATGIAAGELAIRLLERGRSPQQVAAMKQTLMRYGIPTAGALGTVVAITAARKLADKYIDKGDPKKLQKKSNLEIGGMQFGSAKPETWGG